MRVLIAPDKFKGTLTAHEAASAIARGWKRKRPQDDLELLPISDGGDGFGGILGQLLGARRIGCVTVDAAQRKRRSTWWWHEASRTAVIESADVIGLALLPKGRFHPFDLDTFGLAQVFKAAQKRGARRIIVGVGGSATNDGGFGLARGLGWQFLDRDGRVIEQWTELDGLAKLTTPPKPFDGEFIVAVDVWNQLLGRNGCTRIYGPQKGIREPEFSKAEVCLRRLAKLAGPKQAKQPGAGAAGGLGFGLMTFCGARVVSGFELFARQARLAQRIRQVDLVITGEGALDRSSRMGKGVGQLVVRCRRAGTPCLALAGKVTPEARGWKALKFVAGITDYFSQTHAEQHAEDALGVLAARAAVHYGQGKV